MINRKHLKLISLILILIISIGFAYLTSSLFINGLVGYKGNSWNIYFDNIKILKNDIDAFSPTINNSKDTIDFDLIFNEPGETFKFSVDVVNDGTIDAMLSEILTTGINSSNSKYLSYTVKYYDDTELSINDGIKAGTKTRLNVEVNYKYDTDELAPVGDQDFSLKLTYVQASDSAVFKNSVVDSSNNNIFTINNAKSNSLSNLKIYGNSSQTTYKGQNLFDVNTLFGYDSSVSIDEGWITVTYDNTNGSNRVWKNLFSSNMNLKGAGTNYKLIAEIKNISGTGELHLSSSYGNGGQLLERNCTFSSILNKNFVSFVSQVRDVANPEEGLRTYVCFDPGQSGTITFRISVLEDTTINSSNFVYEPYVGGEPSPNPEYPQEINSVTGNSTLKITGKNLLNYSNLQLFSTNYGVTCDNDGNIYSTNPTIDTRSWNYIQSNWYVELSPGTYTLSLTFSTVATTGDRQLSIYDIENKRLTAKMINDSSFVKQTFTINEATTIGILVKGYDGVYKVQLEEGDTATEWEPYQERVYPISLNNLELNKIGEYRDYIYFNQLDNKWLINRSIEKERITSANNISFDTTSKYAVLNTLKNRILSGNQSNTSPKNHNTTIISNCLSWADLRMEMARNNLDYIGLYDTDHYTITRVRNKNGSLMSLSDFNDWINNSNVLFYYILNNPYSLEINDSTLLSQLNAIRTSNLFNGVNHIYFDSNIDTDISFDYIEE